MTLSTIAETPNKVQLASTTVYEYSFSLINPIDNDIQDNLTAAFTHPATYSDWQQWLQGWSNTGYELQSQPILIRVIN